ncbi:MAG: lipopolysaccharide biosynthesis protein [Planctomycetaceae bacterium]
MNESATAILNPAPPAAPRRRDGLCGRVVRAITDPFARDGLLSVFDQAVVSGTSFFTSVLIGRLCGKEDLGVYYLALSIVLFIRGVQEQVVSAPFAVFCHRLKERPLATYIGSLLLQQGAVMLVSMLGIAAFAGLVNAGFGPAGFESLAWVLIAAVPLMLLRESLRQLAFGRLSLKTAIAIDVAVAILQLGGLAALALGGELTVGRAYLVMAVACGAAAAGWWLFRSERVCFDTSRFLPDWKQNWSFSKWALSSHVVGCSTPYILPWFVAAVDGTAATGVLAACSTLIGIANAFTMGLGNYLTPKAARSYANGGVPELRRVLVKTGLLFTVTVGGFAVASLFAGNVLAVAFYGDEYAGAGPILAALAFALFANSISVTAGNGLWAMGRPSANFRADVCALIATVIAALLLTPLYGVMGAALSSLIGVTGDTAIRTGTLCRLMRRERGLP